MAAYVIGHVRVKDAHKWAEYRRRVPATFQAWDGELVMRGERAAVLAGEHDATDVVVLRFPNIQAAHGWHDSPEYQALIPLREEGADVMLISFEESAD